MIYYEKAAEMGDNEAKIALAVNFHRIILQQFGKNGSHTDDISSEHLYDVNNQELHQEKWILLEQVAASDFMCSFLVCNAITVTPPSSFQLPPLCSYSAI